MSLFSTIRNLTTAANLVKGVITLFTTSMSVWVAVTAMLAEFPTPIVILLTLAAALAAAMCAYFIIELYEKASFFLTSRKEQNRIQQLLDNLGENVDELDLATAAGIWAGTLAGENIERHSYFRGLKNAIKHGHLIVRYRPKGPRSGPGTRVELNSLRDFWRNRKVIR